MASHFFALALVSLQGNPVSGHRQPPWLTECSRGSMHPRLFDGKAFLRLGLAFYFRLIFYYPPVGPPKLGTPPLNESLLNVSYGPAQG